LVTTIGQSSKKKIQSEKGMVAVLQKGTKETKSAPAGRSSAFGF
jgi:hypothetical protein